MLGIFVMFYHVETGVFVGLPLEKEVLLKAFALSSTYTRCVHCTGCRSKDGNTINNFKMPWDIVKIFGRLVELIATNKATRHFFV